MNEQINNNSALATGLKLWQTFGLALVGVVALHLSYAVPALSFLILVFLMGMAGMSLARTRRLSFYPSLVIGFLLYGPQLPFFWAIFGPVALLLWLVLSFWLGMFSVIAWFVRTRLGVRAWLISLPVLWTGVEYFRSELYYLRFSWINAGYTLSGNPQSSWLLWFGMSGVSFIVMGLAAFILSRKGRIRYVSFAAILAVMAIAVNLPSRKPATQDQDARILKVAGIQAEFPLESYVPLLLDKALAKFPDADLFMLSEYTFDKTIPEPTREWCRTHKKYLVAGGKDPVGDNYYNTAFVVDPNGEIVFKQAKSVPIQFFADGLPAPEIALWESPWGKLAIPTCYDLSYTRVIDGMVALGAQGILNPTMDVVDWGAYQHELHARVPQIRAAEHGIPIFRIASSGISQLVNANGITETTASFPGDEEIIGGEMILDQPGRVPPDRWLAPACTFATAALLIVALIPRRKLKIETNPNDEPQNAN